MDWPEKVYEVLLAQEVAQVAYVPDAGHTRLIELCLRGESVTPVPLTTEEEGVALLAGAWLGGRRGALLMQSSGVGNCINMLGFTRACRFPLLMLVTMRGQWGEFNPWQLPMGQATASALQLADVIVHRVEEPASVAEVVGAAARMTFHTQSANAVLLSQRLLGAKTFGR